MKVRELIEKLAKMPPDAEVGYVWDGAARSCVDNVWLAQSGEVLLAYDNVEVYDTEDRPISASTS